MKLNKKELEITWGVSFLLTTFCCILFDKLNTIKNKSYLLIYNFIIIILYFIYIFFLLYFLISKINFNTFDLKILWVIFVLTKGFTAVSKVATEERFETFYYLNCSFIMLYVTYLYKNYY